MTTPAGWYDDGSGRQRWWDGQQWTEHFAPESAPETSAAAAAGSDAAAEASAGAGVAGGAAFEAPAFEAPTAGSAYDTADYPPYAVPGAAGAAAAPAGAPAQPAGIPTGVYPGTMHGGYPGAAHGGYPTAGYPPAGAAAPAGPKKLSVLGLIGLGLAALGTICAFIPGVTVLSWLLLPAAFIVSIISLFLKGTKWPGITGLVLSIVGTILAIVMFFVFVVAAANSAFEDAGIDISEPVPVYPDDAETEDEVIDESSGRDNPEALGALISGDEYDVVVNSVTLDATEQVLAANQFNEAPADGFSYAVVNMTVTYTGEDSGYSMMAQLDYVTEAGEVISAYDSFVVAPDPALGLDELYTGASVTGNLAFAVPVNDAGVLRVTPGIFEDEVFVALQ